MAATLDGMVECQCHGQFLIKVKCPFSKRNTSSSKEAAKDEKFFVDENGTLKSPISILPKYSTNCLYAIIKYASLLFGH